jgi:hypothetical protein
MILMLLIIIRIKIKERLRIRNESRNLFMRNECEYIEYFLDMMYKLENKID